MYGTRALVFAAYFFAVGYAAHKKQVFPKIGKALSDFADDMNRRSAKAFFEEAERHPRVLIAAGKENPPGGF